MADASASTSASTTAAASPAPPSAANAPASVAAANALDGLSATDLRIRLDRARKQLRSDLDKKRKLDRDLAQLEQQIYAFEGSYLSDSLFPNPATSGNPAGAGGGGANAANAAAAAAATSQFGNIIRGYDSYLKAPSASAQDRKRFRPGDPPSDKERMFSASSATFHRSVELRAAETAASVSVEPESEDDYGSATNNSRRKQRTGRH
ncbi:hypothetical protein JCM3774_004211 [Rhodotorula dairenensis]